MPIDKCYRFKTDHLMLIDSHILYFCLNLRGTLHNTVHVLFFTVTNASIRVVNNPNSIGPESDQEWPCQDPQDGLLWH